MTLENITFKLNESLRIEDIIQVFDSSGIVRPIDDESRIAAMFKNSNLIVSAWDDGRLIGVARALTDFSYCCYLSDLVVNKDYQNRGVGKKMVEIIKNKLGEKVMFLLLSVPSAMEYYPKIGFEKVPNGFIIKRKK